MIGRILRQLVGAAVSLGLALAMLGYRNHLAIATAGLVFVIPVVIGVVSGGFTSGLLALAASVVFYDLLFIPPYYRLTVGKDRYWLALAVYVVVMVLVAQLVSRLNEAREASTSREANARRLLDLSELMLADHSAAELADIVVEAIRHEFGLSGVALLQAIDQHLEVIATAGTAISAAELARLQPEARIPVALSTSTSTDVIQTLALVSSGHPIGLLALRGLSADRAEREILPILANDLAIALERAQLRERVLNAEVLEEVDRLRQSLIGAVSHDLRSPLATIKVASSSLLDADSSLSSEDANELYRLIDLQTDRLSRLVSNLLDMTRIQSGALEVRPRVVSVETLLSEAVAALQSSLGDRVVEIAESDKVLLVEVDPTLIVQVLANLLDNANRHAPPGTPIVVAAGVLRGQQLAISVSDQGIGIPKEEREAVFEKFVRFDTGGRSGLGLAIAKAFVEAHGDRIWVEEAQGGGARFVFTVSAAELSSPRR